MKNEEKANRLILFLAFAMYFLTGAACIVVGSSLPQLVELYQLHLETVVLLSSAFAVGRVGTVYGTGIMVEKYGPKKVLAAGTALIGIFLVGIPTIVNFPAGLLFAALGGAGMGAQDTVCPLFLSRVCKKNYAGALSGGQALFGLGNFATPFLVGIMLRGKLPFYLSYYILAVVAFVMLIAVPFVKWNQQDTTEVKQENVKPLYVKNMKVSYVLIIAESAAYSAVVNTLMLYTSSLAESIGVSASSSAFMLTIYNVGCFLGSFAFIGILSKVKEESVLIWNNVIAFLAILVAIIVNRPVIYFICLFIAGFFLGVLFSVIIAIATRIQYEHISKAGSLVATAGGASDILTPIVTGIVVSRLGIHFSYPYVMIMIVISLLAAFGLKINTVNKMEDK